MYELWQPVEERIDLMLGFHCPKLARYVNVYRHMVLSNQRYSIHDSAKDGIQRKNPLTNMKNKKIMGQS